MLHNESWSIHDTINNGGGFKSVIYSAIYVECLACGSHDVKYKEGFGSAFHYSYKMATCLMLKFLNLS